MPAIDFTYRYSPEDPKPFFVPENWEAASVFLQGGNSMIARFYDACRHGGYEPGTAAPVVEISESEAHGHPVGEDGYPVQMPFALVLGCSDARVPTELLFGQEFNDIFNIRVAGNILAEEGIGSLLYALRTFVPDSPHMDGRSLKLTAVLGHRGCGAVRATVRTFRSGLAAAGIFGDPIGSLVSKIASPSLPLASELFDEAHGPGASTADASLNAMVDLVVHLNAAWVSHEMKLWVDREGPSVSDRVGVVFGIFDPADWRVHARPASESDPAPETFETPPRDLADLREYGRDVLTRLTQTRSFA